MAHVYPSPGAVSVMSMHPNQVGNSEKEVSLMVFRVMFVGRHQWDEPDAGEQSKPEVRREGGQPRLGLACGADSASGSPIRGGRPLAR